MEFNLRTELSSVRGLDHVHQEKTLSVKNFREMKGHETEGIKEEAVSNVEKKVILQEIVPIRQWEIIMTIDPEK